MRRYDLWLRKKTRKRRLKMSLHLLSVSKITAHIKSGQTTPLRDGGNLSLVHDQGAWRWQFRYRHPDHSGRSQSLTHRTYPEVSLADAREWSAPVLASLKKGIAPLDAKRQAERQSRLERAKQTSFRDGVEKFLEFKAVRVSAPMLKNMRARLDKAVEKFGSLPCSAI